MPGTTDTARVRSEAGQEPVPTPQAPSTTPEPAAAEGRQAKTIEARNLNLFYGDFHAVENVTMTIAPNKVTALIGSSGCGKTTFLRSLNRMHELNPGARVEGEVTLDGHDIYARGVDPVQVRRLVGMVAACCLSGWETMLQMKSERFVLLWLKIRSRVASSLPGARWISLKMIYRRISWVILANRNN